MKNKTTPLKTATDISLERELGGLKIVAVIADSPSYRRMRSNLEQELVQFLRPYNGSGAKMDRHDAAMVCGVLTLAVKGLGIDFVKPFTVKAEQQKSVNAA